MPGICGTRSLVATGPEGQRVALPLRCRKWSCPVCGPRLKKKLIRRFVAGHPDSLLTLTSNPSAHLSPKDAFLKMTVALNHLMKRIRRRWPTRSVQYAVVWELTKEGWPHAHLLLRASFIPQPLISAWWQQLTGAKIVDIRHVDSDRQVARYVGKYLTKALSVPYGYKRFRTSRNFSAIDTHPGIRELMGTSKFALTPWQINEWQTVWQHQGLETSLFMGYVLVGYAGPESPPGYDPEYDTPYAEPIGLETVTTLSNRFKFDWEQ